MVEDLLRRLARALDSAELPYMVVGGQAVLIHAEPRLTQDIDLTLSVGPERADDVLAAIQSAGLKSLAPDRGFIERTFVVPCMDVDTGIRVDVILSNSEFEHRAVSRAMTLDLGGQPVRFATAEDLVVMKVVAGRPRDLEDVRSVVRANPALGIELIELELAELDLALSLGLIARFRSAIE